MFQLLFFPVFLHHTLKEKPKSLNKLLVVTYFIVYLAVMTSLLAVRVGYNILSGGITAYNAKQNSIEFYEKNISGDISEFAKKSNELFDYLQDTKIKLLTFADNRNTMAINEDKSIDISKVVMLEDGEKVKLYFMGENREADKMRSKISEYLNLVESNVNLTETEQKLIYQMLTSSTDKNIPENWGDNTFGIQQPLIAGINKITQFQEGIKFAKVTEQQ